MRKRGYIPRSAAAVLASVLTLTSVPVPVMGQTTSRGATGEIKLNPQHHYQTLEGWGTSLCWWGNMIGADITNDYNNNGRPDREEIAELAFSPEYLNLNIVRYNVGGGDKEDSTIKRVEGRVPGWSQDMFGDPAGKGEFLADTFYSKAAEDMNDAGQIWMLEQANKWRSERGENDIINEVFSNSPPYYMTKSGSSTGGKNGDAWNKENLKDDYYDDFGQYLARATRWLDQNLKEKGYPGIHYVEPINEPDTNYWLDGSTKQEGCIFYPGESQNKVYQATRAALNAEGMEALKLTGTDETSLDKAIWSFNHLDNQTRKNLAVISAHTYGGTDNQRVELRNMAASYDKGLWMSEVTKGGGSHSESSHDSMSETQTEWQSKGIMSDLKKMQPTAWIAWLVADSEYECIQTNQNWGLLHYVFEKDGPVKDYHTNLFDHEGKVKDDVPEAGYWAVTKQFYTMMQYSKFLKAGYTMVDIADENMCAAVSPDRKEMVIVAQNFGEARNTSIDLQRLPGASEVKLYRTSDSENCAEASAAISGGALKAVLPENSVSTYVITAEEGKALYDIEGYKKTVDCDVMTSEQTAAAGASGKNKFTYEGNWNSSDWIQERYTTTKDSTVTFSFSGTGAAIYGKKSPNGAELQIQVDEMESVSASAAAGVEARRTLLYQTPELEDGDHTVTIRMAEEQTAEQPEIVIEYGEIIKGRLTDAEVEPLSDYITVKGVVPNLPHTVLVESADGTEEQRSVEWNATSDLFDVDDFTTISLTGTIQGVVEPATANVTVLPENLQYFIDCNNLDSSLYQYLDGVFQLNNEVADQSLITGSWGYLETYSGYNDGTHRLDTGWYAGKDQSISYQIPLTKGTYDLSFGFKEWWAQWDQNRPMKITASYKLNGETVERELARGHITDEDPIAIVDGTLEIPEDTDVTLTVSKTGNQDPVLSYFTIQRTMNHAALKAALGQARTLDRSKQDASALKLLDDAVEEGYRIFVTTDATEENSNLAAKKITDALSSMGTESEFTKEQLEANDYILYLANCGTPDASVVPDSYKKGLMQSSVDQPYGKDRVSGTFWGYAPKDDYSRMVSSGMDASSMTETYVYMGADVPFDKERSGLKYAFAVSPGDYQVTLGFKNPWSSRHVNVKLEGQTAHEDLNLIEGKLIEKEYMAVVDDGELNVMVHTPNRQNQYGDPMLSYIIVRAVPEYSLEQLADAMSQMIEVVGNNTWYEDALKSFEKARTQAAEVVEAGNHDSVAIRTAYIALSDAFAKLQERVPYTSFSGVGGAPLYDTNGKQIQAHGGQIQQLTVEGETRYYWIGEDKTYDYRPVGGIHVYSSDDLYNWRDEGVVLRTMESMNEFETDPYFKELYGDYDEKKKEEVFIDLDKNNCVMERPKMLYNEKTDKYVIWFHADGRFPGSDADYGKAKAGIAISDSPAGPFKLLGSYKLNYHDDPNADHGYDGWAGRGSVRDMNLFKDDDGSAYVIYSSEGNKTTFVSRLNDSYTDLVVPREEAIEGEHFTRHFIGWSREAPAMFKYNDKYYIVNSGCTGWSPNPAQYMVADHPMGPWKAMGDPCEGWESDTTFRTQSTCVFPVDEESGKYIYMGDRWNNPDLSESRYVWLPVEFMEGDRISLKRYEDWSLEELDNKGLAKITTELPKQFESLADMKAALPEQVDVAIGSEEYQDVKVTWNQMDETKAYAGKYWVSGTLEKDNRSVSYEADIVDKNMIYFFDSGAETSDYFELLEEHADNLKNAQPDQAYETNLGAGYLGTEEENFGRYDGQELYSTGWWAKKDQAIEYRFDLKPGKYKILTGYQEWWNTNREMNVTAVTENPGGVEMILAEDNFTLQASDQNLVRELSITVPKTREELTSVTVSVEKRGDADPVLCFVGIVAEQVEEEGSSIAGTVMAEDEAVEGISVNLYEGTISLASPSEAEPIQTEITGITGAFEFFDLENGTYSVEIPAQNGFMPAVQTLSLNGTDITEVNFALEAESVESEAVTIRVGTLPTKRNYLIGEELNLGGIEVILYRDGIMERTLKDDEYTVSEFDSSTSGSKELTVTYMEASETYQTSFTVQVHEEANAPFIKVVKRPTKRYYMPWEDFQATGMEVRGFHLEDTPIVVLDDSTYQVEYDFSDPGEVKVTIVYETVDEDGEAITLTDAFEVTVLDVEEEPEFTVEKIEVVKKPYRLVYGVDDAFEPEGMVVEKTVRVIASPSNAVYQEEIPLEVLEVEEDDFSKTGSKKVRILYQTENSSGEELTLYDTVAITVTKSENSILEDNLNAAHKKLEDALLLGEYLTLEEKLEAMAAAVSSAKDCFDDGDHVSTKRMNALRLIEKTVLDHTEHITTQVQADDFYQGVKATGLALSADFEDAGAQQISLRIGRSSEQVPRERSKKIENQVAMDITLHHQGDEIQPGLPIEIQMDIPTGISAKNLVIYHNHNGEWSKIQPTISGKTMTFIVNQLSVFVVANEKEEVEPSKPSRPSGSSDERANTSITTVPGTWKKDAIGWWYQKQDGGYLMSTWAQVKGQWYYFDAQGYMKTGWIMDGKGIWYYLMGNGAMAVDTVTPDGYQVDATGAWNQR